MNIVLNKKTQYRKYATLIQSAYSRIDEKLRTLNTAQMTAFDNWFYSDSKYGDIQKNLSEAIRTQKNHNTVTELITSMEKYIYFFISKFKRMQP